MCDERCVMRGCMMRKVVIGNVSVMRGRDRVMREGGV